MESILNSQKGECYACGRNNGYERHHIFFNALRPISEELGLVVYLCPDCHRGTNGVHGMNGKELNHYLKRQAQYAFEKTHTREEWMQRIGRNWL